jgi:hypothetical protein
MMRCALSVPMHIYQSSDRPVRALIAPAFQRQCVNPDLSILRPLPNQNYGAQFSSPAASNQRLADRIGDPSPSGSCGRV